MSDFIRPFYLSEGLFRGAVVKASDTADEIIRTGKYPTPVGELIAEAIALAALLASSLKYDGIFTLQIKGSGAVKTIVTDITHGGEARAYARWDEAKLKELSAQEIKSRGTVPSLLGSGYVLFMVDNVTNTERYQGTTELIGETLSACILNYFKQSDQINTVLKIASKAPKNKKDKWQVAGIMLQQMPLTGGKSPHKTEEERAEEWNTDVILLSSLNDKEILDTVSSAERLLFTIYNEQDITVFNERPLSFGCRCSKERIKAVISSFPEKEINDIFKDGKGKTKITCEFCGKTYDITKDDLMKP